MARTYHRPSTLSEAVELLARPDVSSAPLAGGTILNTQDGPDEVIDLQALGLDSIELRGETLLIGAMTPLQALVDHELVPPALAALAHREGPNTFRNMATVGGTIGSADAESELLAGLLVYGTRVGLQGHDGTEDVPLEEVLSGGNPIGNRLIVAIAFEPEGFAAAERTGRTPADKPIVVVVGHQHEDGQRRFAATGFGDAPVLIDLSRLDELHPNEDFRGSADYRRHLAATLGGRVVARLDQGERP